jgi:hypothetical protein
LKALTALSVLRWRSCSGANAGTQAFRADLSRPYGSELERDLKSPTVDTLFRICDTLEVSAASVIRIVDAARKWNPT